MVDDQLCFLWREEMQMRLDYCHVGMVYEGVLEGEDSLKEGMRGISMAREESWRL